MDVMRGPGLGHAAEHTAVAVAPPGRVPLRRPLGAVGIGVVAPEAQGAQPLHGGIVQGQPVGRGVQLLRRQQHLALPQVLVREPAHLAKAGNRGGDGDLAVSAHRARRRRLGQHVQKLHRGLAARLREIVQRRRPAGSPPAAPGPDPSPRRTGPPADRPPGDGPARPRWPGPPRRWSCRRTAAPRSRRRRCAARRPAPDTGPPSRKSAGPNGAARRTATRNSRYSAARSGGTLPKDSPSEKGSSKAAQRMCCSRISRLSGLIRARSGEAPKRNSGWWARNWSRGSAEAMRTASAAARPRPARPACCRAAAMLPG